MISNLPKIKELKVIKIENKMTLSNRQGGKNMSNWLGLENSVVVVTGGASGIGKHVVNSLVNAGAQTVVVDLNVKTGESSY